MYGGDADSVKNNLRTIELFVACNDLPQERCDKSLGTFCAVMMQCEDGGPFEEVSRTESVCRNMNPQFCTSIEVNYEASDDDENNNNNNKTETSNRLLKKFSPMLRFDVYERKTETTERLRDHRHRGSARARIHDLLHVRGNQLRLLLHDLSAGGGGQNAGTILIIAEQVNRENPENNCVVQVDVCVPVLRRDWDWDFDWKKKKMGKLMKKSGSWVMQWYELCRAHKHEDEHGRIVWIPVYRSDRVAKQRDGMSQKYSDVIEFSTASMTNRQLCNTDEERDMRIIIYGYSSSSPSFSNSPNMHSVGHSESFGGDNNNRDNAGEIVVIGYAEFTLRFLCELDPTAEVLGLEREGLSEDVGTVSIERAEPTDYGSFFSLRVRYEDDKSGKLGSVISPNANTNSTGHKLSTLKLVKWKATRGMGGNGGGASGGAGETNSLNMLTNISIVNGLFSTDSDDVEK